MSLLTLLLRVERRVGCRSDNEFMGCIIVIQHAACDVVPRLLFVAVPAKSLFEEVEFMPQERNFGAQVVGKRFARNQ